MTALEHATYLRQLAAQEQAPAPREAMLVGAAALELIVAMGRFLGPPDA